MAIANVTKDATVGNAVSGALNQSDFYKPAADPNGLGKDAFMKLLITQLQNQDPLNPMDDKQFIAQMAQFSSLEQLTNINDGITKLGQGDTRMEMLNAVNYIGKEVQADGGAISLSGGSASTVAYTLPADAGDVTLNVFDAVGNRVQSVSLGARKAGNHEYVWNGRDQYGNQAPDGAYQVLLTAQTPSGQSMETRMTVSGKVTGLESQDGRNYLVLEDGRVLDLLSVQRIVEPKPVQTQQSPLS